MGRILEVLSNIFKIADLRKKIFITLGILVIFRLGCFIPLPGVNTQAVRELMEALQEQGGRLFGIFQVFSGGALREMSLFSLGIMPYITASIIFSLLTKAVPYLEQLAKEGPSGYRKIQEYTRYAVIPVAMVQSIFIIKFLEFAKVGGKSVLFYSGFFSFELPAMFAITAGAFFVMWLGELISGFGIGNGASIIITVGIIARMPSAIASVWVNREIYGTINILIIFSLYVLVVIAIVFMTQAQRRIPIQYGKFIRGRKIYTGGARQYLPFSLNQSSVMPVIFAVSVMALPLAFGHLIKSTTITTVFSRTGFIYTFFYVIMVYFFTYFWVALMYQPKEIAENLKEYGSFLPGTRPGEKTAEYIEYVLNRITLVEATFLAIIAILPDIAATAFGVEVFTSFLGGTGILIVVGVGLDTLRRVESYLIMHQYEGIVKGSRIKGRR